MKNLVWNSPKPKGAGSTKNFPYFGTVTAAALTENVDMANPTKMVDTLVTITPAEVGAQIILTWKLMRDDQEDVRRAAGRILGDAMELKRDDDLLAHFASGTNQLGSNATLSMGMVAAGRAILAGVPAPSPYAVVHHPYTLLDLVDVLTPTVPGGTTPATTPGNMTDDVLKNYIIGRLFGMNIYEDCNLNITSSNACGGVFATGKGGGILLCTADEWQVYPEDDASLRATELNVVGEYGTGVYLAGWIVGLANDATTPA